MPKPRIVVDTNIWVSYLIFRRGVIAKVGQLFAREKVQLIASEQCLGELREVLGRGKWDQYAPRDARLLFFEGIYQRCEMITPTTTITASRDPRDDKFLELALDGQADYLITGDTDSLSLAKKPAPEWKFRIVTPTEFLEALESL